MTLVFLTESCDFCFTTFIFIKYINNLKLNKRFLSTDFDIYLFILWYYLLKVPIIDSEE